MLYNFIELIILLYTILIFSFDQYKEYMISLISFSKLSNLLAALLVQKLLVIFEAFVRS